LREWRLSRDRARLSLERVANLSWERADLSSESADLSWESAGISRARVADLLRKWRLSWERVAVFSGESVNPSGESEDPSGESEDLSGAVKNLAWQGRGAILRVCRMAGARMLLCGSAP
jgi:hypothetical protein